MNSWKNKKDFIKWVTRERNKHNTFIYYLTRDSKKYPKKYNKDITSEFNISSRNSTVNPLKIKTLLNDKILEHLNAYLNKEDVEIFHIYNFLKTIESVDFFKLSKFSNDAQEYRREVKQLKKMADKIQLFSKEQLTIQIPILPFISIYLMIEYFKRYGLSKDKIKIFSSYFGLNSKYRTTKSFTLYIKKVSEIRCHFFKLKSQKLEDYNKERRNKYNGWSYRTIDEYNEMIQIFKEIDKYYDKNILDNTHYYKAIKKPLPK